MSSDEDDNGYGSQGMKSSSHKSECQVCGSTSMMMNEEGSMICEDCGVVRVATQEIVEDHEKYMNPVEFAQPFFCLQAICIYSNCTTDAGTLNMVAERLDQHAELGAEATFKAQRRESQAGSITHTHMAHPLLPDVLPFYPMCSPSTFPHRQA
jgi:hypothetical protein